MTKVRTRFAPSPTGFMHVGNVRTALFAWLFARHNEGTFILRIEDTDKNRLVEDSVQHIYDSLKWLGVDQDEGPVAGGDFGPYTQSERLEIYKNYAQQLIDKGLAYADPFTPEQVSGFREQSNAEKRPFLFRNYRPEELSTPDDWYGKVSIRFKASEIKRHTWQDIVRGELTAGEEALDDFVIIKSDGFPTYNFAHVIDDHEMQITHVIRGEEFIPSVPKFISLHDALGFSLPEFITVPPILNANGGKKLSKRDGAKDVLEYKTEGYSPDAIINFLASLGWNDGTEREIFTPSEIIEAFDATRIQRSGAKFDETKLNWISWQHNLRLIEESPRSYLLDAGIKEESISEAFAVLAASKSRNAEEFKEQYGIFDNHSDLNLSDFDLKLVDKKLEAEVAKQYIEEAIAAILGDEDFSSESIEATLRSKMEALEASPRQFLNLIRWVISNRKVSPNLFEMISIIGKEESIRRLQTFLGN